jgi:hypothetical protein
MELILQPRKDWLTSLENTVVSSTSALRTENKLIIAAKEEIGL